MTPANHYRLGIDLGGTKIFAVVIDRKGNVLGQARCKTEAKDGYKPVLDRIAAMGRDAMKAAGLKRGDFANAGLAVPGPIDPETGEMTMGANLGWGRKPVADDIKDRLDLSVVLGNDGKLGALGESTYGAAAGAGSVCAAFLGTGLGAAVVINGRVLDGAHGFAGEIGHMRAPYGDTLCGCGRRGCLETVASKRGVARMVKAGIKDGRKCRLGKLDDRLRSSQLRKAWKDGCELTREALTAACAALGWGLAAMGTVVDPEVFVLGGGVMEALGKELLPVVRDGMRDNVFYHDRKPDVRLAKLGDFAVAVGAAVHSQLPTART